EMVAPLPDERENGLDRPLKYLLDGDFLSRQVELAGGDPSDVQKVVDQPAQVVELALDDRQGRLELAAAARGHADDLDGVGQRRQRVAQLVRQRRQENVPPPALGFGGIRAVGQRIELFPEIGAVAQDLAEADAFAVLVQQRQHYAQRPETGAVSAPQPAVVL